MKKYMLQYELSNFSNTFFKLCHTFFYSVDAWTDWVTDFFNHESSIIFHVHM